MYLTQLSLKHFKNFTHAELELRQGFHFITGANGAGKTNFLDAIFYASMTRSFLTLNDKALVELGRDFFRIEAWLVNQRKLSSHYSIKFRLTGEKEIEWNGKKYKKISDHLGNIPVVIIAPDEVYELMNSQEARRKFLNQTLVQVDSGAFDELQRYNKLIKQRNAALKQMRKNSRLDDALLEVFDRQIVPLAIQIARKRKALLEQMNPAISSYLSKISRGEQLGVLEYKTEVDESYSELLITNREKDYFTQRTNSGIHKDQLRCMLDQHLLHELGSQGQMKSFVVAMKLAQFNFLRKHKGSTPLFLLDDIFAKLDSTRVESLLEILQNESIDQCFITDTHTDRLSKLISGISMPAYLYHVNKGIITFS